MCAERGNTKRSGHPPGGFRAWAVESLERIPIKKLGGSRAHQSEGIETGKKGLSVLLTCLPFPKNANAGVGFILVEGRMSEDKHSSPSDRNL